MYAGFDGEEAELLTIRAEGVVIYEWAQTYGHMSLLKYALSIQQKKPSHSQKQGLLTIPSPTEDEWSDLLLTLAEQSIDGPSLAPPIEQVMRVLLLRIQSPSSQLTEDLFYYVNHCLSVCQYGILSPALAFATIDTIAQSSDAGAYLARASHLSHKTAAKRARGALDKWAHGKDVDVEELVEVYGFGRSLHNDSLVLNFESAQSTLAIAIDGEVTVTTSSANAQGKGIPRWFSQEHPEDAKVVRATVKQLKTTIDHFVLWCQQLWLHDTYISPDSFAHRMEHDLTRRLAEGVWWITTDGQRWRGSHVPDIDKNIGIRPWHPLDGTPPSHDEGVLIQVDAPVATYDKKQWSSNCFRQWRGTAVQRTTLARACCARGWTFSESWPSSWAGEPVFVIGQVELSMTGEEAVMWGQPVTVHDLTVNDRKYLDALTDIQYSTLIESIDTAIAQARKK